MSIESIPEAICKSCGVPFRDHLGLVGTCDSLKRALIELSDRKARMHTMAQELGNALARVSELEALAVIAREDRCAQDRLYDACSRERDALREDLAAEKSANEELHKRQSEMVPLQEIIALKAALERVKGELSDANDECHEKSAIIERFIEGEKDSRAELERVKGELDDEKLESRRLRNLSEGFRQDVIAAMKERDSLRARTSELEAALRESDDHIRRLIHICDPGQPRIPARDIMHNAVMHRIKTESLLGEKGKP